MRHRHLITGMLQMFQIFKINLWNLFMIFTIFGLSFSDIPWPPKENYIAQSVDHFNFISIARGFDWKFKQRYLYEDKWFKPGGPIFFYCGNEGGIESFWNNTGLMFELAPKFNALVVFGEHRYYGKSLPFGSILSIQQPYIQFLSIEQALADYVYMLYDIRKRFQAKKSQLIAFGGSYGGILAAFMRFKYPNIVLGALVSSAPIFWVFGFANFGVFFNIITKDFNDEDPTCVDIVKAGYQQMITLAKARNYAQISKSLQLCTSLTSMSDTTYAMKWLRNGFIMLAMMDYPYKASFMGDLPAFPVKVACQKLKQYRSDPINAVLEASAVFYRQKSCYKPSELFIECSDITGCGLGSDSLAWDFQVCTEMKQYDRNNSTKSDSMFPYLPSTLVNIIKYCKHKWKVKTVMNRSRLSQCEQDIQTATNVIYSNGDLDPWSLGGIISNKSLPSSSVAIWIKGGAHHLDLRSSNKDDPPSVRTARVIEENFIQNWLKQKEKA